ncbi:hypothetical protein FOA52_014365 [Chlamydomonas sp. UWO 241]|nr:hypothetical protein FOA52_014365 [Chlamydomonas sp. UWO 241]
MAKPAGGGVVSASFLNAKLAVGGIGVEPRAGGVLRVLFTVASDAVAGWEGAPCLSPVRVEYVLFAGPTSLPAYVGPVELVVEPGKGRSVRTTRDVACGELLLVSRPAAVVTAPPGSQPQPPQLHAHLQQQQQQQQAAKHEAGGCLLDMLCDGSAASMADVRPMAELARCRAVAATATAPPPVRAAAGEAAGPGRPGPGPASGAQEEEEEEAGPGPGSRLLCAIELNAYGEPWGDESAWACRGQGANNEGFLGVWPAMAMINHSCAPNAATMVLRDGPGAGASSGGGGGGAGKESGSSARGGARSGRGGGGRGTEAGGSGIRDATSGGGGGGRDGEDAPPLAMLVRAARDLRKGEEVAIAYTGRHTTSPLLTRRKLLRTSYGFDCTCARCVAEEDALDSPAAKAAAAAAEAAGDGGTLRTQALRAADAGDVRALRALRAKLCRLASAAAAAARSLPPTDGSAAPPLELRAHVHAWAYPAYELVALCDAVLDDAAAARGGGAGREEEGAGSVKEEEEGCVAGVEEGGGDGVDVGVEEEEVGGGEGAERRRGLRRGLRAEGARRGLRGARGTSGERSGGGGGGGGGGGSGGTLSRLQVLSSRVALLGAVSPGSYQHAALSARLLAATQTQLGPKASRTQAALEGCIDAHAARYGRVTAATLARLVDGHEGGELVALLVDAGADAGAAGAVGAE